MGQATGWSDLIHGKVESTGASNTNVSHSSWRHGKDSFNIEVV